MKEHLYTGAFSLPHPDKAKHHFGLVGGYCEPQKQGTIRMSIDTKDMHFEMDGTCILLDIPETFAIELARVVHETVLRMEFLRVLYRRGKLAPDAIYNDVEGPLYNSEEEEDGPE